MDSIVGLCLAILGAAVTHYLFSGGTMDPELKNLGLVKAPDILETRSEYFEEEYTKNPHLVKVTDGVQVALGFALGNTIILEGDGGLVVVDTTESIEAARDIKTAVKAVTDKEVKAIVYTHYHADHNAGTPAWLEDAAAPIRIIGHEKLPSERMKDANRYEILQMRGVKQFGCRVPDDLRKNAGMGKTIVWDGKALMGLRQEESIRGDKEEKTIAGLRLIFLNLPGETDDHLVIWLPEKRVLLCGDNFYHNFPNVYSIRGVSPRDISTWAGSIKQMLDLRPEYLIPSHSEPVIGADNIQEVLGNYRRAMVLVYEQSMALFNKGYHPDEAAKMVKLPKEIASLSYLQERYGTIEWTVKSIFTQSLGWFSGDPVDLSPLSPTMRSKSMVNWLGINAILDESEKALKEGDYQWALELSSYVFRERPTNTGALIARTAALKGLAENSVSINSRNYYLSTILDDNGFINWQALSNTPDVIDYIPHMVQLFEVLKQKVKSHDVYEKNITVVFEFTDTEDIICLHLETGILEVQEGCDSELADIKATMTGRVWKDILTKRRSFLRAYVTGDVLLKGGLMNFKTFMDSFDV